MSEELKELTNMAMYQPNAWIVSFESDGQIARRLCRQKRHISSWWVVEVEGLRGVSDAIVAGALSEDNEVMAVEMDWMRCRSEALGWIFADIFASNDEVNIATIVVLVYDGVLWIPRRVAEVKNSGIGEVEPGTR